MLPIPTHSSLTIASHSRTPPDLCRSNAENASAFTSVPSVASHPAHPPITMTRVRWAAYARPAALVFLLVVAARCIIAVPRGVRSSGAPVRGTNEGPMIASVALGPVTAAADHMGTRTFSTAPTLDCKSYSSVRPPPRTSPPFTLAHALNVPRLANSSATPELPPDCHALFAAACGDVGSILARYARLAGPVSACGRHPFVAHFRDAVREFGDNREMQTDAMPDMFDVIADSDDATVIQVHVDSAVATSAAMPLTANFVHVVQARARVSSILVIAPTGDTNAHASVGRTVDAIVKAARQVNAGVDLVIRPPTVSAVNEHAGAWSERSRSSDGEGTDRIEDVDVAFFAHARHLVVDRGAAAAVFAMACSGSVYASADIGSIWGNHVWRWQLVSDLRGPFVDTSWTRSWRAVARVRPNMCAIEHVARGDGEKFVCANMAHISMPSCWVLSLGCGGLFQFERHVVHDWGCSVALFDCTGSWSLPEDLNRSVKLTRLCVAAPGDSRENYKSLAQLIKIGASAVGVDAETVPPVLVKMDVEGFEYPVLADLLRTASRGSLPRQMVVEFHLLAPTEVGRPYEFYSSGYHKERIRLVDALSMMGNLSKAGYVTVHRADNPTDDACSELTLVRRDSVPSIASGWRAGGGVDDEKEEVLSEERVV